MGDVEKVVNILKLKEKIKGIRFEYTIDDSFEAYIEKDDKIVEIEYNELITMTEVTMSIEVPKAGIEDEICSCSLSYPKEFIANMIVTLVDGAIKEWF